MSIFDDQVPYDCPRCGGKTASRWCMDLSINEHPGRCCNCFDEEHREKELSADDPEC